LKSANSSLQFANEELKVRPESSAVQLQAGKLSFQHSQSAFTDLEARWAKVNRAKSLLENQLGRQANEITILYRERSTMADFGLKCHNELRVAEAFLASAIDCQAQLRDQLRLVEQELVVPKPTVQPLDPIPTTSWFSSEFPSDLVDSMSAIAENQTLPINAKPRQVLNLIGKYYNDKLCASADELGMFCFRVFATFFLFSRPCS
jgi:hypothetical protein